MAKRSSGKNTKKAVKPSRRKKTSKSAATRTKTTSGTRSTVKRKSSAKLKKAAKKKSVSKKKSAPSARSKNTGRSKAGAKSVKPKAARSRSSRDPAPSPPPARITVQLGSERIELPPEGKRVPKTKLTKKQLSAFTERLLTKRSELVGDVLNLTDQALAGNSASGGLSHMPIHMADVGSDNWEQEFTLGLIDNERALVREIDEALQRIKSRTYGICLATHRPIDMARLRAKPWAKYCIEYARLRELGRVP